MNIGEDVELMTNYKILKQCLLSKRQKIYMQAMKVIDIGTGILGEHMTGYDDNYL